MLQRVDIQETSFNNTGHWRTFPLIPRLHDTTGCQTGLSKTTFDNRLSNRVVGYNRIDNRLYRVVYKHLTGCQTGLTTVLTTGCIV